MHAKRHDQLATKKANRANARASTGPKTAHGRIRAAQNARRHGLSLPIVSEPWAAEQIESLTREIADGAPDEIYQLAYGIAEAQIELVRVHHARLQFLSDKLSDPQYDSQARILRKIEILKLLRPNALNIPNAEEFLAVTPQDPQKFATILSRETKALLIMDRYERRGLSRRKIAIRAVDLAQQRTKKPH